MRAALLLFMIGCGSSTPTIEDAGVPPSNDAMMSEASVDAMIDCGEFANDTQFTCSKDGNSRGKCVSGVPTIEMCPRGCLRQTSGDICMGTTTMWSCNGSYGTEKAQDGDYYLTSFGCWVDANMTVHTDPGDNCIPACLAKAQATLCKNLTGPQCEEQVDWFVADSGRFGCLARLRVENPKNGKKVIVLVLDAGPACSVEANVSKAVLDASGRVDDYLFGAQLGYSDKALVHVVEVDSSTPLGPI
jgi:hypothetical protein